VFYHPDLEVAKRVAAAVAEGGCPLLEFTNRGDHAWEVFSELERYCAREVPNMILGVGSVVDPGTASLYINCGANFVVGPLLNADVARACNRRKVPYSPGCGSASEISQAEELGCEIVKVFPGSEVGGPSFVKAVKGPCPWVSIMPTGGVDSTEASLKAWFDAGVTCVGMGSNLVSKDLLKAGDYAGIASKVRATLEIVRKVRGGK
jgi:2-dehydro-3-deoxyphosphogluconate aldolase/(4S)-4-hydroxy-2-oxoglutarate aldolase